MDQFLDWFDMNATAILSPHAWVWAMFTAVAAIGCLIGMANIARRYSRPNITVE